MMDDFEKQLKNALRREEPSPFFEARVLGAIKRQEREHRASSRLWWATAAAAALLLTAALIGAVIVAMYEKDGAK